MGIIGLLLAFLLLAFTIGCAIQVLWWSRWVILWGLLILVILHFLK